MSNHDESNYEPPYLLCFCEETECIEWDGNKCLAGKSEEDCVEEYFETCDGRDRMEDE